MNAIPPEVRDRFNYHGNTHALERAHDGTWMLREKHTGRLDGCFGRTSVYGVREDGTVVDMLFVEGRLYEDRSVPASPENSPPAGQGFNP